MSRKFVLTNHKKALDFLRIPAGDFACIAPRQLSFSQKRGHILKFYFFWNGLLTLDSLESKQLSSYGPRTIFPLSPATESENYIHLYEIAESFMLCMHEYAKDLHASPQLDIKKHEYKQ